MKFTYTSSDRPLNGYTIQRGVGRGGFGEVYQAMSDGGKEVALKLIQRNLEVELRGVAQCLNLKHSNLVNLYDVKRDANGDCWVVMEFVAGETLDVVIASHPNGFPPDQVLAWLKGLCDGVAHLHAQGLVHRDLKPGNVFREEGVVKIGDYGLSKFISTSHRSGQTGSVGTVHYMAPEVAHGRYGKEVDLYAIGIMIYEMLTGRVPFDGASPGEILMKHMTATPDLSPLPPAFRLVVARLLHKDPMQRYSSVQAMMTDLMGYIAAPPVDDASQPVFAFPISAPTPQPAPTNPLTRSPGAWTATPSSARSEVSFMRRLLHLFIAASVATGAGLFVFGLFWHQSMRDTSDGSPVMAALWMGLGVGFLVLSIFLYTFFRNPKETKDTHIDASRSPFTETPQSPVMTAPGLPTTPPQPPAPSRALGALLSLQRPLAAPLMAYVVNVTFLVASIWLLSRGGVLFVVGIVLLVIAAKGLSALATRSTSEPGASRPDSSGSKPVDAARTPTHPARYVDLAKTGPWRQSTDKP